MCACVCKYYVTTGKEKKNVVRELSIFFSCRNRRLAVYGRRDFLFLPRPRSGWFRLFVENLWYAPVSPDVRRVSYYFFFLVFRGWPAAMHWTYSRVSSLWHFSSRFRCEKDIYYSVILVVRIWHCEPTIPPRVAVAFFLSPPFFFFFSRWCYSTFEGGSAGCIGSLTPPPSSIVCSWERTEMWQCTYIYMVWKRNRWAFEFLFPPSVGRMELIWLQEATTRLACLVI